jgi:peptidoglycan/LPS O-acetylase OafA/YrhL
MRVIQLDILRAVAVLLVLGSHMDPAPRGLGRVTIGVGDFWRAHGHLGVDLFFVLSGFLVAGLLFREHKTSGFMDVRRFLIRRGFKIYPAFYVFLIITVLLRIERGTVFSPAEILCEALFVQNYGPHVWSHTWSLAVEEHFYLLLAALFLVCQRTAPTSPFKYVPLFFLGIAALVPSLRALTFQLVPYSAKTHSFATHLRVDELFLGVFLSYLYHFNRGSLDFVRGARTPLFLGSVLLLVGRSLIPSDCLRYVLGPTLASMAFGGILLVALNTSLPTLGPAGRFFSCVGFVGSHSYSIYLWHTAVLVFGGILARKVLGGEPGFYLTFLSYMTAALVFGILMAKVVEIPSLRIRDRLFPSPDALQRNPPPSPGAVDIPT